MAAVQIGIPKRIIYIKNTTLDMNKNLDSSYNEGKVFINPVIIRKQGLTRFLEGCESCTYQNNNKKIYYTGLVDRPYLVEVEYFDVNGNKKIEIIEGSEATIFCHEDDHLDGILHMDKLNKVFEMTYEEMKDYRNKHPYDIIDKDYIWDEEKEGNKKFVKE